MTDHENLTVRLWDVIHDARSTPSGHAPTSAIVAAVLPILAEEVRKAAKAAWDDAIDEALDGWTVPASGDLEAVRFILLSSNPYMPKEGA